MYASSDKVLSRLTASQKQLFSVLSEELSGNDNPELVGISFSANPLGDASHAYTFNVLAFENFNDLVLGFQVPFDGSLYDLGEQLELRTPNQEQCKRKVLSMCRNQKLPHGSLQRTERVVGLIESFYHNLKGAYNRYLEVQGYRTVSCLQRAA